ncbi:tyrosine-type recombinase/integrase [Pseudonocardia sp. RS010]|uniref:tyrosine-type recombinase/integrase n=1 Tax=Pseudonocardia sp. RS010 TaxID=3385979 RepID=UPI0039A0FBF3
MAGKNLNGQGSVYQRKQDGMWIGAAYVLTTTGHRKRITVSSRDPDEARRALTRKIADSDAGIPVAAQTWTVAQYLAYWLEHIVKPRRPKTYQGYEGVVRRYLTPILGRKKLHRLTAPDVKMMMTRLRTECRCCADGTDAARDEEDRKCCAIGDCCHHVLSVRTVQFVHAVLRNALQNAVREEMIPRNVAKLVQVETPRYRINRGLSLEQAKHLLTAAKGDRLHALYVLALYLGMRRAELLGLRWVDVDLEEGTLEIVQTLQRVEGRLQFLPPKTDSSARTVPLIAAAAQALKDHRIAQHKERLQAGFGWTDTGLVFTSRVGTPLEPDNLRRSWYPLRKKIDAEGTRFHDLRHSCVTLLLGLGVPPHVVQEIVGHADMSVTLGIYAHVSLKDKREALALLQERIG